MKKSISLLPQRKKTHRIVLYIRVSTEEQAENPEGSMRNQEERLRETVKLKNHIEGGFGEVTSVYRDVLSGKDTNRPQLQRLLAAIGRREVDLVLVTELSRLSRNMRDFAEMWELMRSRDCGIYSLRENFDTTTAAGEMVLYTIANIAQFERRQTAERISANFTARAQRGLYNGGPVPLGYQRDLEKVGFLRINPEEAEIVRKTFEVFVKEQSINKTARWLNENGYRLNRSRSGGGKPRLGFFSHSCLPRLLRNKSYLGIKTFIQNGTVCEAKAVWPALISETLFNRAQELMEQFYGKPKNDTARKYPFILSGVLNCHVCGDPLVGRSAHGRGGRYPYYDHGWAARKEQVASDKTITCSCNPRRISAPVIEQAVWDAVLEILANPKVQRDLLSKASTVYEKNTSNAEIDRAKKRVEQLSAQLQALAERLSQLPTNVPAEPIYQQMAKLDKERKEQNATLSSLEMAGGESFDRVVHLQAYRDFLEGLKALSKRTYTDNPVICQGLIRKLIHRVEIVPTGFVVHYYVGEEHIEKEVELDRTGGEVLTGEKQVQKKNLKAGSTSLTNGGPTRGWYWKRPPNENHNNISH